MWQGIPCMIRIMSDPWPRVFDTARERQLDGGCVLFRRGEPVRHAFLMRSGRIALRRALRDGGLLTLQVAAPGDLVAEGSIFAQAYHCDAVVETAARIAVLPREDLVVALNTPGPQSLALEALARSTQDLRDLRMRVEIMRLRRLSDRLDAYLEIHGAPEPGGWARVADWIGVSSPALYRELARRRGPQGAGVSRP